MARNTVRAGAQAPESFRISIAADPTDLDLTTVTGPTLRVAGPQGSWASWSVAILSQTASLLVLEHVFSVDDLPAPGAYQAHVTLPVPGGVRRAEPVYFEAVL